jgi:hypothetical protein
MTSGSASGRRAIGCGQVLAFGVASCLLAGPRPAAAAAFTDPASFFTAIAGLPGSASTQDFESLAAGTTIPSGGTVGGITFSSLIGLDMIVSTGFDTTSGANYLGLDDGADEVFIALDLWEMGFSSPLQALGLYVVTSDALFADDIRLVTSAETAQNSDTEVAVLPDGGFVYFLGLVSATPFGSAQAEYGPGVTGDFFVYNVDDITTVTAGVRDVPEPSSIVLLPFAALVLAWIRRV